MKPIIGKLVRAGTFPVGDEDSRDVCPGLHISVTEDALRSIEHLPLYQEVAVVPVAELQLLRGIIARYAKQQLNDLKFYVRPDDIKAALNIAHELQQTNPEELTPLTLP